jgi:small subunit ribosomal protein S17
MEGTLVVEREYTRYIPKYERYEKRTSKYLVHNPPCLGVNVGDSVKIAECRPLSKAVAFVVVQKL